MRQKSGTGKAPAELALKDIRRASSKQYSAEQMIQGKRFIQRLIAELSA